MGNEAGKENLREQSIFPLSSFQAQFFGGAYVKNCDEKCLCVLIMKHFLHLSFRSALLLIFNSPFLLIFDCLRILYYMDIYINIYLCACICMFICIYSSYTIPMDFAVSSPFHTFFPLIYCFPWCKFSNQPDT